MTAVLATGTVPAYPVHLTAPPRPDRPSAGVQAVELEARPGSWVAVVMPADGSAGVRADVDVAATLPWLAPAGGALLAVGVLLLLGGAAAMALAVRAADARVPR